MRWPARAASNSTRWCRSVDEQGATATSNLLTSNLLLIQVRDGLEQFFTGERTDRLRRTPGGLRISAREVVLDRSLLGTQGLSVFF